jgi:cell fate (sporulation/competence/biofilm development) regulator YmcA (YheA/YmcA/DUF963 family)
MKLQIIITLLLTMSLCQDIHNGFLAEYHNPTPIKLNKLSPQDALDFSKGFMSGLTIFDKLPVDDFKCAEEDIKVIDDLADIIEAMKNFRKDYYGTLKIVTAKAYDIYEKLNQVTGPCKALADDLKTIVLKVRDYMESYSYVMQFSYHTMREFVNIENKLLDAKKLWMDKQYQESGKGFGDMVHFAFLWAFNN